MHVLEKILQNVNGASFIGLDTITEPVLKGGKKNPLQGRIVKYMEGANVMVFTNKNGSAYDAMVQRRLAQEGKDPASFQLSPRTWGERKEGTPFIEHNGELYLEVIFLKPGRVFYRLKGNALVNLRPEEIEGLDTAKDGGEQGGLSQERKVILRTFKVSSIRTITIDGTKHQLQ